MKAKLPVHNAEDMALDKELIGTPNSLAQVILTYWRHSAVLKHTSRHYALCMIKILEVVRGAPVHPELVQLSEITKQLIPLYQDCVVAKYQQAAAKDTTSQREARERALRTTRSTIRQARSLFARRGQRDMIEIYESLGIVIPECINGFVNCKALGKSTKMDYNAPPDSVMQDTLEQIELMRGDTDLYIAFWIAIGALLRRSEIHRCRWEHILEVNGRPRIIGGIGKDSEKIDVPLQPRAYQAILPFRKESGRILKDTTDKWARRLCDWMKERGWNTRLKIHELRKWSGSQLYKKNPVVAMRTLRHSSIKVTEDSYVKYALENEGIDFL